MMGVYALIRSVILAGFVLQIHGRVKVSFRLVDFENTGHIELNGDCCDPGLFSCDSCDNRFNLCFDVYKGNNDMTDCAYGNFQTDRLYENNDDFSFPSILADDLVNPIVLTINSWSTGLRFKIEVWDYDPRNADDKIDYYGYDYTFIPDRTSALATEHTVTLNGAGTSLTRVAVKVYCDMHYYGTSSGCSTYCLARNSSEGHYNCDGITGARVCHSGWQGSYCDLEINECDPDPCQFNAICTDLLADYSCDCPAGTRGKNCDDINECSSDPCEHGGTCENKLNQYQCHCPREYSGAKCEFEIDFCDSDPCQNGATCLGENDNGVPECVCAPGYTGVFCDADIDECIGVDCLNNGTCQDGVNEFTCNCTTGYGGTYCELDIRDECASKPCQNNASCVDKVGGYVCVCRAGFQSGNCEVDVNECDPDPCSYGNCTDQVGRYTCDCWPGYSGENCTVNIDECVDNTCENNSTCQDGVNNYTCSCMPGYTDVYCDTDIDECSSSPCQNGGRCEDSLDSFTCQCASTGYQGLLCEIDIDECQDERACPSNKICANVNGSYDCNTKPPEPTPIPGLCRTSVCYNEGTCLLIDGRYKCVCTDDFSGELCETPTDPCSSSPCQNNGSCQVLTAGNGSVYYICQCPEDYAGTNCELQPCFSSPCQNNGSCHVVTAGDRSVYYSCQCPKDYVGTNCELHDTITLQCGYFSMTVTIPLTLVGGMMSGEDLHLLGDDDCTGMISEDTRFISITTNFTACNNAITEDDEHIVYSNTAVARESKDIITRLKQVTVPFYCSYNRSEQVGLRSYRVTDYQLNFTEVSTGRYKFALDIFKDDDFEERYADSEYPVDVNLNEELYFGASVPSQDGALDLSIRSCVATPSASYDDEQWTIIRDGCAFETSTHIDDGALGFVAVTINTFRFVELGNRVYIHCDLLVCQATTGNETSECDAGCVGSSRNRDRRDIVEKYSLDMKRITKGPLRLRRNSYFNPSLNGMFNSEENPALHQDFNPWIVVTVALATICIIIVVVLSVMLRKMTSYAHRNPLSVGDQECEALLET